LGKVIFSPNAGTGALPAGRNVFALVKRILI